MKSTVIKCVLGAGLLIGAGPAFASDNLFDFNSNPTNILNFCGTLWDGVTSSGTGSAAWIPTGGAGAPGNTTNGPVKGVNGDGFLQITFASPGCNGSASSSLCGGVLFNDFDTNLIVAAFTFECDLRIGNGDPNPADGFSINYIRSSDPVLIALNAGDTLPEMNGKISANGGQFSDNGSSGDLSLMEEGTTTGFSVGLDMWDSGNYTIPPASPAVGKVTSGLTHDGIGFDIRVDGTLLTTVSMPNGTTQGTSDEHGNSLTATDTGGTNAMNDPTSIETGPYDGTFCDSTLYWVHLKVVLDTNGLLNVWWKNSQVLTNLATGFAPSPGRLLMASRVGGNTANIEVDNVHIITIPSLKFTISPPQANAGGWFIQFDDSGPSLVQTNTLALTIDGTSVTPTSIAKTNGITTANFIMFPNLLSAGSHTVVASAKDNLGNTVTDTYTLTIGASAALAPSMAVSASSIDKTKPGFNVETYWLNYGTLSQETLTTLQTMENSVRRAMEELGGVLGANQVSSTIYEESGVINYNINTNAQIGDWMSTTDPNDATHYADKPMPGIPQSGGTDGPTEDNYALDITTYIYLPEAGVYNLTFNSDDGFRMTAGNPANDQFNAVMVCEYDGGRGASDTTVPVLVTQPGYYPFRTVYFQGNGGGNCEWSGHEIYPTPTTNALLNDATSPTALQCYQVSSAAYPAAVTFTDPVVGSGTYQPTLQPQVQITDGSDGAIPSGSIAMYINGTAVTPTINKSGKVTTVSYAPANLFASGSQNTLGIAFKDASGNFQSNAVPFTVQSYVVVPGSMALSASTVDKTSPGFTIKTYEYLGTVPGATVAYNLPNSVYVGEMEQHGFMGWPNSADLTSFLGPDQTYQERYVINYNGQTGNAGGFNDPSAPNMPGIPSLNTTITTSDGDNDNYSLDIWTVINLTPGYYTMNVNSDDGCCVSVGNPAEWSTMKLILGQFDGGRGSSGYDAGGTTFNFYVGKAGLYPFRCLYYEGGGGNNVEWSMVGAYPVNNTWVLLNDSTAQIISGNNSTSPALLTYQYPYGVTKGSPYVASYGPSMFRGSDASSITASTHTGYDAPIYANLVDGDTAIDASTVQLWVNGAKVTPSVTKSGTNTAVKFTPSSNWTPGTTNTVTLAYLDRSITWSFMVENHPNATFFIEAEDVDYNGGQTVAAASVMPYYGGAYSGLSAQLGVDYFRANQNDGPWYRMFTNSATAVNIPEQFNRDLDRGVNELQSNFRIGWIGSGQWYNYTRTFPAGSYNVYAGISNGDGAGTTAHDRYAVLQVVTASSTNNVGVFDSYATGGWGQNGGVGQAGGMGLVPLTDPNGNRVTLNLSGKQTLRYWLPAANTNATTTVAGVSTVLYNGSGDWDFMIFTPPGTEQAAPTLSLTAMNGQVVISFTGTLSAAASVEGPYQDVAGATSPYTVPVTTAKAMFFRTHN